MKFPKTTEQKDKKMEDMYKRTGGVSQEIKHPSNRNVRKTTERLRKTTIIKEART